MKKFLLYSLTLAAAASVFTSCSKDEDMIFDDSAANRLDKARDEFAQILTERGGKWVMEYFTNPDEAGFVYVMTFSKDGSVTISGNNDYIGKGTKTETSLWGIITDSGVVLSLNSYNSLFHIFADPDNYSDGSGIDHTGTGHAGDYEFVFLEALDGQSILRLKGKKHSMPIYMYRVDPDVDDVEYLDKVAKNRESMFSSKINEVVLTYAPTGERFLFADGAWGTPSVWPEAGDAVTQEEYANIIVTADGFRFMVPFQVSTAANPSDSITIQRFLLQPDGTLLCDDEFAAGSTIKAPELDVVVTDKRYSWAVNDKTTTGVFANAITDLKAQLKASKGTFKSLIFRYDNTMSSFYLYLNATQKSGVSERPVVGSYRVKLERENGKVKIAYVSADADSQALIDAYPALGQFLQAFNGKQFEPSATNLLAPNNILLTSGSDVLAIDVQ